MNLKRKNLFAAHFVQRNFGQSVSGHLYLLKSFMLFVRRVVLCCVLAVGIPAVVFGQASYYATNGTEYGIVGSLLGDQVLPDVAVTTNGGFVVWQDNITDGNGEGVSAMQLYSTLSGTLSPFRVNQQGAGDQENPRVALLKNGGAVFVWQGGQKGYQHIYAGFLTSNNTFLTTNDVSVNTFTNNFQINPAVATLTNGNVVVVWGSFDEASSSSLQDVYGRIFSPTGQPVTGEFLINQYTPYNQRTPTVAALPNGGFVVAWISEQEQVVGAPSASLVTPSQEAYPSVDVYARLYNGSGVAQGNEFLVDAGSNPCANPSVAAGSDGGFMIAWDARDMTSPLTNSLDIYARQFTSTGSGGTVLRVNTYLLGDQYAPRISSLGTDYLIVWTSLAQDGSREGVYGQFLQENGSEIGGEFRVNTTTVSSQMQPTVASDGAEQFLVVWTSYTGAPYSFDLFAQRYLNSSATLQPMAAPFIYAPFVVSNGVYLPQLQVSWSPVLGLAVSNYEVYVDGAPSPTISTTNNVWTMTSSNGLTANSTRSFTLDYMTTDGRRSPLSPSASGTTWLGYYWGTPPYTIPVEWMSMYFGPQSSWPSTTADSDGDGMNNYQEFLAGTIPTNAASVLRVQLSNSQQGLYLSWTTQPGQTYQVQVTTNFSTWNNVGSPRFAAGNSDSIFVGGGAMGYYRIVLLRQ
jgi:hypothetical protein